MSLLNMHLKNINNLKRLQEIVRGRLFHERLLTVVDLGLTERRLPVGMGGRKLLKNIPSKNLIRKGSL